MYRDNDPSFLRFKTQCWKLTASTQAAIKVFELRFHTYVWKLSTCTRATTTVARFGSHIKVSHIKVSHIKWHLIALTSKSGELTTHSVATPARREQMWIKYSRNETSDTCCRVQIENFKLRKIESSQGVMFQVSDFIFQIADYRLHVADCKSQLPSVGLYSNPQSCWNPYSLKFLFVEALQGRRGDNWMNTANMDLDSHGIDPVKCTHTISKQAELSWSESRNSCFGASQIDACFSRHFQGWPRARFSCHFEVTFAYKVVRSWQLSRNVLSCIPCTIFDIAPSS